MICGRATGFLMVSRGVSPARSVLPAFDCLPVFSAILVVMPWPDLRHVLELVFLPQGGILPVSSLLPCSAVPPVVAVFVTSLIVVVGRLPNVRGGGVARLLRRFVRCRELWRGHGPA